MSNTVEQLINRVDKPSSCVKDPCGICKKTVKTGHQAIQRVSCELWVHFVVMELHKTTTKTLNLIMSYGTVWFIVSSKFPRGGGEIFFDDNFFTLNIEYSLLKKSEDTMVIEIIILTDCHSPIVIIHHYSISIIPIP